MCIKKIDDAHTGKSIWSIDINCEGRILVSGGGDSAVKLWNLDELFSTSDYFQNVFYLLFFFIFLPFIFLPFIFFLRY